MKKCPYCAEDIQDAAIVCRYCGRDLVERPKRPTSMLKVLGFLRGFVGVLQSITVLGGCAGLLTDTDWLLSSAIQWFVILLAVQLGLLLLFYMSTRWGAAGTVIAAVALTVGFLFLMNQFFGNALFNRVGQPPVPPPPSTRAPRPTATPNAFATMLAASLSGCKEWSEVSAFDIGHEICVYGTVVDSEAFGIVGEGEDGEGMPNIYSRLYFAQDDHSFFMTYNAMFQQVPATACLKARGLIERDGQGNLFMNLRNGAAPCYP